MLRLLTILATASCAFAAPFDITNLASSNTATDSLNAPPPTWKRIVTEAPWSARAGGNLEFDPQSERFVLHGVGIYDQDDQALEEVWIGTAAGKFTPVNVRTPFEPLYSALSTQDINGVQYRIQGTDNARNEYPDVYRSANDGKNWVAQHENPKSRYPLDGTRYLGVAVALVNNPSTLLVWGGQALANELLSDVWRSTDSGINWKFVVDTAGSKSSAFGPRSTHSGLATSMKFDDEVIDVIYHMAGYIKWDPKVNSGVYSNDIWISTGSSTGIGQKWVQIQSNAPWAARGSAKAAMTSNGVLVVFGGVSGYTYNDDMGIQNDVWASLDGGYSWGLCSKDAEFSDRTFQQSAIDADGFLWVMGGRDTDSGRLNDIWQTTQSYNDIEGVAQQCNLLIPTCGVGLKCLPVSSGFRSGLWGVTCDQCPKGPCQSVMTADK